MVGREDILDLVVVLAQQDIYHNTRHTHPPRPQVFFYYSIATPARVYYLYLFGSPLWAKHFTSYMYIIYNIKNVNQHYTYNWHETVIWLDTVIWHETVMRCSYQTLLLLVKIRRFSYSKVLCFLLLSPPFVWCSVLPIYPPVITYIIVWK